MCSREYCRERVSVGGHISYTKCWLGIDIRVPNGFDDEVRTSDVVQCWCCPQKDFQFVERNWDVLFRQREFVVQIILVTRIATPVDRNVWVFVSGEALRKTSVLALALMVTIIVASLSKDPMSCSAFQGSLTFS